MPWCETCSRYLTPTSMTTAGECPTCGRRLAEAVAEPKAPWHFKLLLAALVIYLAFRAGQGIDWILQHV
jgi:uncharacterized paraquat-inducible protein A